MNNDDFERKDQQGFEDDELSNISDSLGKQIRDEMDDSEDIEDNDDELTEEKKKLPKWAKISIGVGSGILLILLALVLYFNGLLDKIIYDDGSNVKLQDESFDNDGLSGNQKKIDPNDVDWATISGQLKKEGVINILLVGEEAMADGFRGRSDAMMIATVNMNQKTLKLTSIMRDTYVQIPGYSDNKLNAAYKIGGMPLLLDTIKLNFSVEMDGYVLVKFDSFEKIIDKLGGVDITLSPEEANYLNTTNYISNPKYRNVNAGVNTLNGNQALGYSRIRYVKTIDNVRDDFGRTSRQRTVLNAIFEKYKSKNIIEIVSLLNDVLPLVTTNIQKDDILNYMKVAISLGASNIQTLRIPVDNGYQGARIRSMSVLLPDLPMNVKALHEFIFGESDITVITNATNQSINPPTDTETPIQSATKEPIVVSTPVPTKEPAATKKPQPVQTKKPVQTKIPIQEPDKGTDSNDPNSGETEVEPTKKPVKTQAPTVAPVATTNPDTSGSVILDQND